MKSKLAKLCATLAFFMFTAMPAWLIVSNFHEPDMPHKIGNLVMATMIAYLAKLWFIDGFAAINRKWP